MITHNSVDCCLMLFNNFNLVYRPDLPFPINLIQSRVPLELTNLIGSSAESVTIDQSRVIFDQSISLIKDGKTSSL